MVAGVLASVATMGATEIVAFVLMLLTSLGAKPNPGAPDGKEAMKYAPARADVVFHLDFEAFVPGTVAALQQAPSNAIIKAEPSIKRAAADLLDKVAMVRASARAAVGIDPIDALKSVTVFVTITSGKPEVVGVVRGAWPQDLLQRIAMFTGEQPVMVDGKPMVKTPDGDMAIALDGTNLIGGNTKAVEARLKASWRPLPIKAGSAFARVQALLDKKPISLTAWSPSAFVVAEAEKDLRGDEKILGRDLMSVPFAAGWIAADGVGWTVQTRDASGVERARLASEGMVEMMRAAHHASRGLVRIAFAVLPSYAKASAEVALAVKHGPALLALLDGMSGDGTFKHETKVDAKDRTVTVIARGNHLSEVLPVGGLMPVAGVGALFFLARDVKSSMSGPYGGPPQMSVPPMVPAPMPAPKPVPKKVK